jgi:hypothetical protein
MSRINGRSSRARLSVAARALFVGLVALVVGCAMSGDRQRLTLKMESPTFQRRSEAVEKLVLSVGGAAGQRFSGVLIVDGVPREVSGTTPANYPLEASILIGDFRKLAGRGSVSFEIQAEGSEYSVGALRGGGDRCRFGYHDREVEVLVTR